VSRTYHTESKIADFLSLVLQTACLDITFTVEYDEVPQPHLTIRFRGNDTPMLTAEDGRLLEALKYLILEICGLPNEQVDLDYLTAESEHEIPVDPTWRRT
jgi:predicted RNA-binding protein Jag